VSLVLVRPGLLVSPGSGMPGWRQEQEGGERERHTGRTEMSGVMCCHDCMTERPDLGQPVTFSGLVLKATLPSSKAGSALFIAGSRWRHGFPMRRDAAARPCSNRGIPCSRRQSGSGALHDPPRAAKGKPIRGSPTSVGPLMSGLIMAAGPSKA